MPVSGTVSYIRCLCKACDKGDDSFCRDEEWSQSYSRVGSHTSHIGSARFMGVLGKRRNDFGVDGGEALRSLSKIK